MSDAGTTLLPVSATPLAQALDLLEERLLALPVQMIDKDPETIDARLLDHLAWEWSVDVWDQDWPEDIKRIVVRFSAQVHRHKGTPHAIKTALAAFDVDTELLEWFEPEGVADGMVPGSFRVTAYAGRSLYGETENAIDTRMIFAMNAVVQRVAPVSRALSFRLGERFQGDIAIRAGVQQTRLWQDDIDPRPAPASVTSGVQLAAAVEAQAISDLVHDPAPRRAVTASDVVLRQAVTLAQISTEIHDIKRRAMT